MNLKPEVSETVCVIGLPKEHLNLVDSLLHLAKIKVLSYLELNTPL